MAQNPSLHGSGHGHGAGAAVGSISEEETITASQMPLPPPQAVPLSQMLAAHRAVLEDHYKFVAVVHQQSAEDSDSHHLITECLKRAKTALDDAVVCSKSLAAGTGQESGSLGTKPGDVAKSPGGDSGHQHQPAQQPTSSTADRLNQHRFRGKRATTDDVTSAFPAVPDGERAAKRPRLVGGLKPGLDATAAMAATASSRPHVPRRRGLSGSSAIEPSLDETRDTKRTKTDHMIDVPGSGEAELDDITERVNARLRNKDEQRRRNEGREQKRKRGSDSSVGPGKAGVDDADGGGDNDGGGGRSVGGGNRKSAFAAAERPRKKKRRDTRSSGSDRPPADAPSRGNGDPNINSLYIDEVR